MSLLANFDLVSFLNSRSTLIAVGLIGFTIAIAMIMNCSCCNGGQCSSSMGSRSPKKSMKKRIDRAASTDSKRNSSSSSVRRSPRKSKKT